MPEKYVVSIWWDETTHRSRHIDFTNETVRKGHNIYAQESHNLYLPTLKSMPQVKLNHKNTEQVAFCNILNDTFMDFRNKNLESHAESLQFLIQKGKCNGIFNFHVKWLMAVWMKTMNISLKHNILFFDEKV